LRTYLTGATALDLEMLQSSLLVIGGGYSGAEMAQLFARAGVRVILACRSRLLARCRAGAQRCTHALFRDGRDWRRRRPVLSISRTPHRGIVILSGADRALEAALFRVAPDWLLDLTRDSDHVAYAPLAAGTVARSQPSPRKVPRRRSLPHQMRRFPTTVISTIMIHPYGPSGTIPLA
jgi:glycine/D-amino acid oxidase-like deaminating enzyme